MVQLMERATVGTPQLPWPQPGPGEGAETKDPQEVNSAVLEGEAAELDEFGTQSQEASEALCPAVAECEELVIAIPLEPVQLRAFLTRLEQELSLRVQAVFGTWDSVAVRCVNPHLLPLPLLLEQLNEVAEVREEGLDRGKRWWSRLLGRPQEGPTRRFRV